MSTGILTLGRSRSRARVFGGWDRFDYVLTFAVLALVAFGLVLIYSGSAASYDGALVSLGSPVARQALFAMIGLCLMLGASKVDYHLLTHWAWVLYVIGILSLIFILGVGHTAYGSTRWFDLGPIQVQPSEFAKLATLLVLARYISDRGGDVRELKTLVISFLIVAPPAGLVFIEPDLGTSVVFLAIWLGTIVVAGVRKTHLLVMAALFIALLPFLWTFFISDYQVERISVLIDPYSDQGGLGAGYNNIQSEIAVGSGELFGKGLLNGDQTKFGYLPVATKDFIFSVLGEETGFVGAMVLFSLFFLLLMRGIRAARIAGDTTGQLVAAGIVVLILAQAVINIAVNLSLFPVTGIPLPFVSAGGSSLLSLFVALGIMQSIAMRHRSYRQY